MPLTALEKIKIRDFAAHDPIATRKLLSDAARGDALSVEGLVEGTGLPANKVSEAARAFVDGELDQIFANMPPAANPRITVPPAPANLNGTTPSLETAEKLRGLGIEVRDLTNQILSAESTHAALTAEAKTRDAAADNAKPSWWKLFGEEKRRHKALEKEAADATGKARDKAKELNEFKKRVTGALDTYLETVHDPAFLRIAPQVRTGADMLGAVKDALAELDSTRDTLHWEKSNEEWETWTGGRSMFPGLDDNNADGAYGSAQAAVRMVNAAIQKFNAANPTVTLTPIAEMPDISSGQSIDTAVDMAGSLAGTLGHMSGGFAGSGYGGVSFGTGSSLGYGSANDPGRALGELASRAASTAASLYVTAQIQKMAEQVKSRHTIMKSMEGQLARHHDELTKQLDSLRAQLKSRALAAVNG